MCAHRTPCGTSESSVASGCSCGVNVCCRAYKSLAPQKSMICPGQLATLHRLVVRPPWNAMFVVRFLGAKSHIAAVNSAWMVHE
jgi:hypothetical protein